MLSLLLCLAAIPPALQQPILAWDEALPIPEHDPSQAFGWLTSLPLSGLDLGDSHSVLLIGGAIKRGAYGSQRLSTTVALERGFGDQPDTPMLAVPPGSGYPNPNLGSPSFPNFSLLRAGVHGLQVAQIQHYAWVGYLVRYSYPDQVTLQGPTSPPSLPGLPSNLSWELILNAGDHNGDQFDEYLAVAHDSIVNQSVLFLFDGRDQHLIWNVTRDGELLQTVTATDGPGWPDLNGDGVGDFVFHSSHSLPQFPYSMVDLLSYSGTDGSLLWEAHPSIGPDQGPTMVTDLDGDGRQDILYPAYTDLKAFNGQDGTLLWTTPLADLQPSLPYASLVRGGAGLAVAGEWGRGRAADTVLVPISYDTPSTSEVAIGRLDAASGQALDAYLLPDDLEPWSPDPFQLPYYARYLFLVGDPDHDGLPEYGVEVQLNNGNDTLYYTGIPTLKMPGVTSLSQPNLVTVELPSAAYRSGQLLLSTSVDREVGVFLDGWSVGLVDTLLFGWSQQNGVGVFLDADGKGSLSFLLPNQSSLLGMPLWGRLVVPDGLQPLGMLTMSSLSKSIIVP